MNQLLWLALALAWGTTHLLEARAQYSSSNTSNVENTWGFGQTFPLILLALPILSIGESFYIGK